MSFHAPKLPSVPAAPTTPTRADGRVTQAGAMAKGNFRSLISTSPTGLLSKAKGLKRSLIGGS